MNAEFPPVPAEAFYVRSDKINQQHSSNEMAPGKNRDLESAPVRWPPHKHALEITLLRFVDPKMDLRQRPGKDQRHRRRKTHDRQLRRCENIDEFAQHVFLKSNGFDEFHEILSFFFTCGIWPGCFENPDASVTSRPR